MNLKYLTIGLLTVVTTCSTVVWTQTDSVDVFPLAIGNQWTFAYFNDYYVWEYGDYVRDSGSVTLEITGCVVYPESLVWTISEDRNYLHRHRNTQLGIDTSWFVRYLAHPTIVQLNTPGLRLKATGSVVLRFDSSWPDPLAPRRYRIVDSLGLAFSAWTSTLYRYNLVFRRATGLQSSQVDIRYWGSSGTSTALLTNSSLVAVYDDPSSIEPQELVLSPSYPNPFNPSTQVRFSISSEQNVRFAVYNLLGQEVERIDLGRLEKGVHFFSWDGSTKAGGTYIIRVEAGSAFASDKVLLIK